MSGEEKSLEQQSAEIAARAETDPVHRDEIAISRRVLKDKGPRVFVSLTLRKEDIPLDHPELRPFVGDEFLQNDDGDWYGVGGNYGPTTNLGRLLCDALERRLEEH